MEGKIKYESGEIETGVTLGTNARITAKTILIRGKCTIGDDVDICADSLVIDENVKISSRTTIFSHDVHIDENARIDEGATIVSYEKFTMGKNGIIGRNARFRARSIDIGDFFYSDENPTPLRIGGGGSNRPTARIKIGSRCVMHDSFINVCMPVEIGDDVGLSPESKIITHGFWNSVIEGYSSEFSPVRIGNHVIVGYRAIILPGVTIGDYCSVGAGAVVTKSFPSYCVIGGVPARVIKTRPDYPKELTPEDRIKIIDDLMAEYARLLEDKVDNVAIAKKDSLTTISGEHLSRDFQIVFSPYATVKPDETKRTIKLAFENLPISPEGFMINLSDYTWSGVDDEITDDLRDFLRHYGIRIFSRHFRSVPPKLKTELEKRRVDSP